MSNTRHKSAGIEQLVRVKFLFQRAHQVAARAGLAPDIDLTFDLVGRAQNKHLTSARLNHAPHLGELAKALFGPKSVKPTVVAVQSNDAVRRMRAQTNRRRRAIYVGDQNVQIGRQRAQLQNEFGARRRLALVIRPPEGACAGLAECRISDARSEPRRFFDLPIYSLGLVQESQGEREMFRVERRRRLVVRRDQLHRRRLNVGIGNTRDQRAKRFRVARIKDHGLIAGRKRAELETRFGDHGQRAEAPDIKFAEVVAGHILDHLAARARYPAVGMNHGDADQPVARRPVSAAQWAGAGRRDDTAYGRTLVAERIERDELAVFGGLPVERRERRPGFNGRSQVGGFVLERAVHLRGRNNQLKPRGPGAHFEPRPRARRNHAPALAARESHYLAQLFYIAREGDGAFALVSNAEMTAGRQFRAIFTEHFAQAVDDFVWRDFARARGLGLMIFHKRFATAADLRIDFVNFAPLRLCEKSGYENQVSRKGAKAQSSQGFFWNLSPA